MFSSSKSLIFLFLMSFLTITSAQDPTYIYHTCPNTTTFTRNSTYFTNLQTLLSSLSSRNASYSTGFQNATAGQSPERVTGLFLCRGDVSPEVCRSCVAFAVDETLTRCPKQSEVTLYYDECTLRYSNRNILSTLNKDGGIILFNTQNVTANQQDRFRDLVLSTMNQAAEEASNSTRKFDAIKAKFTAFQNLYGLVQCTPDLTRQDCLRCLQQINNQLPTGKIGGRLIVPSCSSRYELYAFFNESAIRTPPPPPPNSTAPVSAPPPPGKGGNWTVLVVAIVVPIIVAVLLFVAGYCFLAKRAKKTYDTASAFDREPMASARDRLDELETSHGMMQDEMSKIRQALDEKFRFMEESFGKLMEVVTNSREGSSNTSGNQRRNDESAPAFQRNDNTNQTAQPPNRFVKLEFPRYQGGDPTTWISKAKQYFLYQEMPNEQRVSFASYHLEDEANEWWQATSKALREEVVPITWELFEEELWARFGPTGAEDFNEALSKIRQTGSLRDYHREFERLQNKVSGWTQQALVGTYMGGLKDSISDTIRMFKPTTLKAAIEYARMRDDQLQRSRRYNTLTSSRISTSTTVTDTKAPTQNASSFGTPKKLSWDEMKKKRSLGLCFSCDEKYTPGHRCRHYRKNEY